VPDFRNFRILLDAPTEKPALGFDDYAQAFADVILHSSPQFAIGIFGDWGSGKTTLMGAIERELEKNGDVIPVWFNAWRYEREEHLIVPLLDTLREGLATWADTTARSGGDRTQARQAAATVGRAARALFAGLTFRANVGVAAVELDPTRIMESWDERTSAADPLSFYHASFNAMKRSITDFVGDTDRRIVIFVDDLDRCLPESALEVLESMKLFFDLQGFVFVVGLDQSVVERLIDSKYYQAIHNGAPTQDATDASGRDATTARATTSISGTDYIKKIFQVPFGLPRISTNDLRPFFEALVEAGDLPTEQRNDLYDVVWPHLEAATGEHAGSVNPREVKRLINAYTLQMKMLTGKLGRAPDANIVLALQTMTFQWRPLYDLLAADAQLFLDSVRGVLEDPEGTTEFLLAPEPLPLAFLAYVRGPAAPLLTAQSLDVYITSAETSGSTDTRITEARRMVAQLRREINAIGANANPEAQHKAAREMASLASNLSELVLSQSKRSFFADEAARLTKTLYDQLRDVTDPEQLPEWPRLQELLAKLDENLRQLRRETDVGAVAT
jgi:polyhydroxyalkanoate synthesis regulator phasin